MSASTIPQSLWTKTIEQENRAPIEEVSEEAAESHFNYCSSESMKQIEQENQDPVEEEVAQSSVETLERLNFEDAPAPVAERTGKVQLVIYHPTNQLDLDYGPNGHLELEVDDLFGGRYQVKNLLGVGCYAAVYSAENIYTKETVALKIAMCGEFENINSTEEIRFFMLVRDSPDCVKLIDEFTTDGEHGKHHVLVFEMLGPTLYEILYRSNQMRLTTDRVRKFCRDILRGLDYCHNVRGIIHCDLKPCNLMVTIDQEEAQDTTFCIDLRDSTCKASLKIGDFGISAFKTDNVTHLVQSCAFRAPEAHLQAQITPAIDMWSVGCLAYQMTTRQLLFPCDHNGDEDLDETLDHLSKISAELGTLRTEYYEKTHLNKENFDHVFGKRAAVYCDRSETPSISVDNILDKSLMSRAEAEQFCDFLEQLLKLEPKKRLTATQALLHPFLLEETDN